MLTRPAREAEAAQLLVLMRELAAFEDYLQDFAVNEDALLQRAFSPAPECQVFVTEADGELQGYAVGLLVPYTYDLRPTARLKELYVREQQRGAGVGRELLAAVARWALAQGAGRLHWDVLTGNTRAEAFYRQLGGRPVEKWTAYAMDDKALAALATAPIIR